MDWHSPREWMRVIFENGKRIAVLVVGLVLVAAGIVMLVFPGPGLLVILGGLAVLATEFVWAERLLDQAKRQADKAKEKAKRSLFRRRRQQDG
jgi:uncharacterized protein (TIGR02611 family)